MRRASLLVPLALIGLLVTAPAAQAAPSTAFSGQWIGSDPAPPAGDGSTVHLYVFGGTRPRIVFTDEFGTVCVNAGSPVTVFTSELRGLVDGDLLFARFNVAKCGPTILTFLIGQGMIWQLDDKGNADPSDDTLWDGSVLWTRS